MRKSLVPVFDLGGVFIDWNPFYLYRKLFASEDEARHFHETVCTPAWNLTLDAGLPFSQGVAQLTARFPRYWREIDAYDTRWAEMVRDTNSETVAIHDELIAAGVPTYSITNFSREKFMSIWPTHSFLSRFKGIVVSGMEGVVKPGAAIFKLFCDRYGLEPGRCVFIDDVPDNAAAAREFGMQAIDFVSAAGLRTRMAGLGMPVTVHS